MMAVVPSNVNRLGNELPLVKFEWYDGLYNYRIENEVVLCSSYTKEDGRIMINFVPFSEWDEEALQVRMKTASSKYGQIKWTSLKEREVREVDDDDDDDSAITELQTVKEVDDEREGVKRRKKNDSF